MHTLLSIITGRKDPVNAIPQLENCSLGHANGEQYPSQTCLSGA